MIRLPDGLGLTAALILASLAGCGGAREAPRWPSAEVRGVVEVDGVPLDGLIQFVAQDPKIASVHQAEIVRGRYRAVVPKGKMKAVIIAMRPTGRKTRVYDAETDEIVSLVPERFRDGVDCDVADDNADLDFRLNKD